MPKVHSPHKFVQGACIHCSCSISDTMRAVLSCPSPALPETDKCHSFDQNGMCVYCHRPFEQIKAEMDANCQHVFHRLTGICKYCGIHASDIGTIGDPGEEGAQGEPGHGVWDTIELLKKQIAELQKRVEVLTQRLDNAGLR